MNNRAEQRSPDGFYFFRRRMTTRTPDDIRRRDSPLGARSRSFLPAFDHVPSEHRLRAPVPPLDEDVRFQEGDELARCVFVEDGDIVHHLQRRHDVGPFLLGDEGSPLPLDGADGAVGIECQDQNVGGLLRLSQ